MKRWLMKLGMLICVIAAMVAVAQARGDCKREGQGAQADICPMGGPGRDLHRGNCACISGSVRSGRQYRDGRRLYPHSDTFRCPCACAEHSRPGSYVVGLYGAMGGLDNGQCLLHMPLGRQGGIFA